MSDPKGGPLRPASEDNWGIGQRADGSIPSVEDFPESVTRRDADEAAFDEMMDGESPEEIEDDDLSDLDDPLPE